MTAFATPRRTLKLPANMTALAGNQVVRTKQIEAGRSVIEWPGLLLVLCCRDVAPH